MSNIGIQLLIFFVLAAGVLTLQLWLSRRKNAMAGLVLPVIFFTCALAVAMGWTAFRLSPEGQQNWSIVTADPDTAYRFTDEAAAREMLARLERQEIPAALTVTQPAPGWGQIAVIFFACNIPTALCLLVYLAGRRLQRAAERRAVEQTRICDLE